MTTRRSFLKAGLFTTVAGMSAAASAVPLKAPKKWDEEFDFVVIGAGAAGLVAAGHAAEAGLKVLVVEKMGLVGGSSLLCGGKWSVGGTEMQKAKGIEDSAEKFFADMMKTGQNMNDPELVRAFIKASKDEYEWALKQGLKPSTVAIAAGMSVPRAHAFDPADVIGLYNKYAKSKGAEIRLNTAAKRLIWDSDEGRVAGVRIEHKEQAKTVKARFGVLLAGGGFSRNPDLLGKYAPPMKWASVIAGMGTTGDAMLMAQDCGADVLDTNYVKASYGFKLNPTSIADMTTIYYAGAIIVNKDAKRFVNESLSYKLLGDEALSQPEHKSWLIFDDAIRREQMKIRALDKKMWAPFDEGKTVPYAVSGATIEEAAQKAGLDPKVLAATIREYNENAPAGKDKLGRTSLSSGYGKPVPLEKGPFFIMPTTAGMIGTYCGVRIDTEAHVIDVFGDRILGLLAAGECTGGVHGAAYMTGTAFGKAIAFGRIAAQTIVKAAGK